MPADHILVNIAILPFVVYIFFPGLVVTHYWLTSNMFGGEKSLFRRKL